MSNIIAKPFNAAKKIVKAVFRGSPNLVTTEDFNRQIDNMKNQIDWVNASAGSLSDMVVNLNTSSGVKVSTSFSYLYAMGSSFSPANLSSVAVSTSGKMYINLYAKKVLKTFENDSTHEISGATFANGVTKPAADHYVWEGETLGVSSTQSNNGDNIFICTLAEIVRLGSGYSVEKWYLSKSECLAATRGSNIIRSYNPSIDKNKTIGIGSSYDEAINILDARTLDLIKWNTGWTKVQLKSPQSDSSLTIEMGTPKVRILNGQLIFSVSSLKVLGKSAAANFFKLNFEFSPETSQEFKNSWNHFIAEGYVTALSAYSTPVPLSVWGTINGLFQLTGMTAVSFLQFDTSGDTSSFNVDMMIAPLNGWYDEITQQSGSFRVSYVTMFQNGYKAQFPTYVMGDVQWVFTF